MQIINHQLIAEDGVTVITDLPKSHQDSTVNVWAVPTDYRANGFYVATGNDIPACDHGEPVFSEKLEADEATKVAVETAALIVRLTSVIQGHLDATAKVKGYDSILSACTYSISSNPKFEREGVAALAWRDDVWAFCFNLLAEVDAGTKPMPTDSELLAALPVIAW